MAHEVESMFSARQIPWHGLGTIVEDVLTAREAIEAARLDWLVEKVPLVAPISLADPVITDDRVYPAHEVHQLEVPNGFATVRISDLSILGIVGSDYEVIQNWEAFEFFDQVVDSGEAKYETAMSLRDGRIVAITMRLPKDIMVGGVDRVDLYLVLYTSHDGSRALTVLLTPIRVVCMNTLNAAIRSAKTKWTIKHNTKAGANVEAARRQLGLAFRSADEFGQAAERMINAELTMREFERIVEQLVPSKREGDAAGQTQRALIGTLESSKTIDDDFRMTRWGAYNAIAEYQDWIRPYRASGKSVAEARTEAILMGTNLKVKEKALDLLLV